MAGHQCISTNSDNSFSDRRCFRCCGQHTRQQHPIEWCTGKRESNSWSNELGLLRWHRARTGANVLFRTNNFQTCTSADAKRMQQMNRSGNCVPFYIHSTNFSMNGIHFTRFRSPVFGCSVHCKHAHPSTSRWYLPISKYVSILDEKQRTEKVSNFKGIRSTFECCKITPEHVVPIGKNLIYFEWKLIIKLMRNTNTKPVAAFSRTEMH